MSEQRTVYRSTDGKIEISTNIPGFKWPTQAEKIDGLLSAGLIDQAEAERLRAKFLKSDDPEEPRP